MGKEKFIGALIFILALLVMIYYVWGLLLLQIEPTKSMIEGWVLSFSSQGDILYSIFLPDPMFLVTLPILVGAALVCIIAMWIGWTMITTPAPEPLEDFDFDEEEIEEPEVESTE